MSSASLVRVHDAARELQVTRSRVQQLLREGRLAFVPTPYGRLVRREALEALIAERELTRAARRSA